MVNQLKSRNFLKQDFHQIPEKNLINKEPNGSSQREEGHRPLSNKLLQDLFLELLNNFIFLKVLEDLLLNIILCFLFDKGYYKY